ncbi:hypothetical protein BX666DRAFT_2013910 [Dichotomocladium elegans]|nr:hypothetical protein BX666DRAFT_2013910 [Dichotomocladium elegans]
MPPKYASQRTSAQREMDELRRQVATIARNMTTLMSMIDPLAVQGQKIEEMSAQLAHLIEAIAQPAPASQPESPTVDEELVIPHPMKVVGTKYRRTNVTKTHIIDRVIKPYRRDADRQELLDAQLKGIYSNILALCKVVIEIALRGLGLCTCSASSECICGAPVSSTIPLWSQLTTDYKSRMVEQFEAAVWAKQKVPMSKCARQWAAMHMLEEGWGTWAKKPRNIGRDYARYDNVTSRSRSVVLIILLCW